MLSPDILLGSRYNWCRDQDVVNREWEPGGEKRNFFFHLLCVIFEHRETCHVAMESAAEIAGGHGERRITDCDVTEFSYGLVL